MASCSCSGCCDSSCPEAVSTVNLVTNNLDASNALTVTVDNSGSASGNKTVTFQVVDEDGDDVSVVAAIRYHFVDSNSKSAAKSVIFPTTPGLAEDLVVTGSDGSYSITVAHTGSLDEWYVVAEFLNILYIDGPLNLGV